MNTFLAWPGWAGVQGIASVVGVVSIVAVIFDYRQRVAESALPGVGFEVKRPTKDDPKGVVTMTARRGAVFYDVATMLWGPTGGNFVHNVNEDPIRARWDHEAGPLVVQLENVGVVGNIDSLSVGVVGLMTTPMGARRVAYRMPLRDGSSRQQWQAWRWWQWRWWPRKTSVDGGSPSRSTNRVRDGVPTSTPRRDSCLLRPRVGAGGVVRPSSTIGWSGSARSTSRASSTRTGRRPR